MTKIQRCNGCKAHEFQDRTYGDKMRVHNKAGANTVQKFRCTVCGNETQNNEKK